MKKILGFLWIVLVITLAALAILCVQFFYWQQEPLLKVFVLDVGQGDAILIETPNKYRILVDGGPDSVVLRRIHEVMPLFDSTIHTAIASHNDADHITGLLPALSLFNISNVLIASSSQHIKFDDVTNAFREKYQSLQIEKPVQAGDRIYLDGDEDLYIEFLHPSSEYKDDDSNSHSLVFKLQYKNTCFIFTGDIPVTVEQEILATYSSDFLNCEVLKVAHHGSDTSTDSVFAGTVKPSIALISSGKDNKYGHPHQSVLDTLEKVGAEVYRTDKLGTIQVVSDGEKVWVES